MASRSGVAARADRLIEARLAHRLAAGEEFFGLEAERLARLCLALAERFANEGRLLAFGTSPQARSDAHHVAVEFVHPVIVGKRALPAVALDGDVGLLAAAADAVVDFDADRERIARARELGSLTIAFEPCGADWELLVASDDPFVRQEVAETTYHVLWELVHVFLDHLQGSSAGAGASSFLYPFLTEDEASLDGVVEDVRRSILLKAAEIGDLRRETMIGGRSTLVAAAAALRACFASGGKALVLGNGGSATDAMDLVADLREPPVEGWARLAALDLTSDPAILTALANDIGPGVLFARQIIAYGRPDDVAIVFSTSGGSANILEALAEARRRGLVTIAFVGYDGGRIAAESLADHVVVTASDHIPRIQEAQATAYHLLRELVETPD